MDEPTETAQTFITLVDLLRHRASEAPDRLLFSFMADSETAAASTVTRYELDVRARVLACRLRDQGYAGQPVLLLYPPGIEFIVAFFGCLYAGAIAVPAYLPRLNRPMTRLRSMAADAGPVAILTCESQRSSACRWAEGAPELKDLQVLFSDAQPDDAAPHAEDWSHPGAHQESLAFLQYTSGSTAEPKGVMITHGNLLHNSSLIQSCFQSAPDSRGVFWLPLFHDLGLIGGVIQTIYCGGSSTLLSPVAFLQRPLRWLETISRTGATISGGPNFSYDLCVEKSTPSQRAQLDLSRWRVAFNGAEPIRAETLDRFAAAFAPAGFRREAFLPCYGLAEATLLVSGNKAGSPAVTLSVDPSALAQCEIAEPPPGIPGKTLAGSGTPALSQVVVIADPKTRTPCLDNQVGEIWISGPSVAKGYWKRAEETTAAFGAHLAGHDGMRFLTTGDLGFLSKDVLFVTGRLKDMIVLNGKNIYPQDIEATAERCHPLLRPGSGAAFAIEAGGVERLVIVHETDRLRDSGIADEILAAIREAIAREHDIDVWSIGLIKAHSLPKTSSGKVQRHVCRQSFLTGALELVGSWTRIDGTKVDEGPKRGAAVEHHAPARSRRAIVQWLTERIAGPLGVSPAKIDTGRPLASFGIGSLQAVSLAGELERWLGRELSPVLIYEHPTIDAIAGYLADEGKLIEAPLRETGTRNRGEPIAIIGIGCRFPGASGPDAFWKLLSNGAEGVGPVPLTRWNPNAAQHRGIPDRGGFLEHVDRFDAEFFGISPREVDLIDPQQRLLLEVSWEALEDAGAAPARLVGTNVGVFVGIATSDYAQLQAMRRDPSDPYRVTGSAASIAANRISYAFDFRGPSLAVDTACSSSLVAVHLACRSLWDGETSLAIAGGVNVILSPQIVENFAKLGFLSGDGRCRAFDARANGYVRGEGAGVVVLKPLSLAIADRDPIYALIRGSAINQDGRTNGLTAPSKAAQEAVLRDAYRQAGTLAGQVDYIEAHGTGTLLGDPIEAAALGSVLAEGRAPGNRCALGSVKTNVGHLEAAAGIAGLIKTALALHHRAIPPSLNFAEPNPHIPFDQLPLYVQRQLEPWPTGHRPGLAGVSSFGFGGTNAHVVLEGWAGRSHELSTPNGQPVQEAVILPLSARSPSALRAMAQGVRDTLTRSDGHANLADLAYTAAVRRDHHEHRLALVASGPAEAIERLDAFLSGKAISEVAHGRRLFGPRPGLAFVFSGQGGLWKGVGRDLFETEPVFRDAIEQCGRSLAGHVNWSLIEELTTSSQTSRLGEAEVDQPFQFALQVALAALWKSWGIVPDIVVGHSLGEIAAAHVAGALSLEKAAKIVALRGRALKSAAGRGRMVAVGLSLDDARRRIAGRDDLFISAVNSPGSITISGAPSTIEEFARRLRAEGLFGQVLDVDIAFHSPHVGPAGRELEAALGSLNARPPTIRFISTLTGQEITGAQLGAGYWGRNVCDTVRLSEALAALSNEGFEIALEVGPHPLLAASIADCLAASGLTPLVLPSLRRGQAGRASLDRSLSALYARGFDLDWSRISREARFTRFPMYPWQHERFWLGDPPLKAFKDRSESSALESSPRSSEEVEQSNPFYELRWERVKGAPSDRLSLGGRWLLIANASGHAERLARCLESRGASCTIVAPRSLEFEYGATAYRGVVYLADLDCGPAQDLSRRSIETVPFRPLNQVIHLARSLERLGGANHPRLWIVTRGAQPVGDDTVAPNLVQSSLWGLARSLALETPEIWGGIIDLDPKTVDAEDEANQLADAVGHECAEDQRAFRQGQSLVPRVVAVPFVERPFRKLTLNPGGTYLITGGLGGLGLQVARSLVDRGARRLVLIGRGVLPERITWDELPEGSSAHDPIQAILALEAQGASVLTVAVDVSDPEGMSALFDRLRRDWPPLRGIVHAAGIVDPRPITELEPDKVALTLRPKVMGTWLLHELSLELPLDFFVLFSSIASVWGSPGQADYAAANAFLDAMAHFRRAAGLPSLCINWGPWAEVGMAALEGRGQTLSSLGLKSLAPASALAALHRLLDAGAIQATVAEMDWPAFGAFLGRGKQFSLLLATGEGEETRPGQPPREMGTEALLGHIRQRVAHVLKIAPEKIDADRPLLSLGLDSLTALELKATIETELGATLSISRLVQGASLSDLAAGVSESWSSSADLTARVIEPSSNRSDQPLSFGQQMLWYAHKFSRTPSAYNIGGAVRFRQALDVEAFKEACRQIAARHDSLRTVFTMVDDKPQARVIDEHEFEAREKSWLVVETLYGADGPALDRRLSELSRAPFDLEQGPLFRIHLLRLSAAENIAVLILHHIIADFWSLGVLVDEIGQAYASRRAGQSPSLEPLPYSYASFAAWQHQMVAGSEGERHWAYWQGRLAGELPVLDLCTDHPRPLVGSNRGAIKHFHLDEKLTRAIVELSGSHESSLYTTLLAAIQAFLSRCSGQHDVIVGSPVAGRTWPGLEGLVGYFVNLLPMRGDLAGNPTFKELVGRTRRTVAEGLEHQDYPFNLLINRLQLKPSLNRAPLFQVMYIHQKAHRLDGSGLTPFALGVGGSMMELHGLPMESVAINKETTLFDLTFITLLDSDRISVAIEYSTDLFDAATIDRMADGFVCLLNAVAADPERRLAELSLVSQAERRRMLGGGREVWGQPDFAPGIHHLFEAQVARSPDQTALISGDESVTYHALNQRANRLAYRLMDLGVGPETVVGLCALDWTSRIVGLLGILKAGGAYLPLDPDLPGERLAAMIDDSGARVVLTEQPHHAKLSHRAATVAPVEVEATDGSSGEGDDGNPDVPVDGRNLACVIYTSGSTGRPKGVMVAHSSLKNAALAWEELYRLRQPPLRHLQAAAFAFDVFTGDWIRALTTGGTLVACPRETLLDPTALIALIRRERIGCMELVPMVADLLADELERQGGNLASVRILAVGSDTVSHRLYQRLARLVGSRGRVVNSYGLTEATIDSTCYEGLPGDDDSDAHSRVPIGLPLAGTRAYVLDKRMEPVPMGAVGELYIGGRGIARGYANDASRTAERFLADPFDETGGARLYRTGDLARWRPDGNLEHLGRVDRQVKIRGVRIEPAEIETALGRHPKVSQVVVAVRDSGRARRNLVAYVVRADGAAGDGDAREPTALELRGWLRERLPEPMVPAAVLFVETMPLLPSGKIDHAALAALDAGNETLETNHLPPRTAAETILMGITAELLGRDEIGIEEDFFELGIDSILGIQLIARARMAGLRLSPAQLFQHPTIAMLAKAAEQEPASEQSPANSFPSISPFALAPEDIDRAALEAELASKGGIEDLYPLTSVQEGMLFHTFTDPGAPGLYVEEFRCRLQGTLNLDMFREAWCRLVARRSVLRSAFRWSRAGRPYQIVHRTAEPRLDFHDLRGLDGPRQLAQIEVDLQNDRQAGLDVASPPLMRLALYQTGDQTHELIWRVHHVIVDGWCLSILLGEVLDLYESLLQGLEPSLPPSRPFRDYIAWLQRQDFSAAEAYWRESLRGITSPTPLGLDRRPIQPEGNSPELFQERETVLSVELTERLRALARASQVTLSTLIQGAWALLLSRYSGQRDVVFGVAVSGRPPELPGIESMIGLFINTLPLRVTVAEEALLIPWLKKLQANAVEIRRYEAVPLPRISAWSEIAPGMALFDSVVIFQNLPFVEKLASRARRLGIESPNYREKTHYPLALTAIPGAELQLRINIDARCFDIEPCERMLAHFVNLLAAIADDAERRLLDLPLISKAEQEQLLGQWSHAGLIAQQPGHDVDQLSEDELDALILGWAQNQGENHEPSR